MTAECNLRSTGIHVYMPFRQKSVASRVVTKGLAGVELLSTLVMFCSPAHNELGMCKASLVSRKQSVLNSSAKVY